MATADIQSPELLSEADLGRAERLLFDSLVAIDVAPGASVMVEVVGGRAHDAWTCCQEAASLADARFGLSEALSSSDREEIARIARKEFTGDKADDRILKAVRNALTSLFQALYSRRSMWRNEISIEHQS